MALLYRFAQLPDSSSTRVFSFVVTRSVVRDPERDVTSKELVCGFQRWSVAFSRGNKVIYVQGGSSFSLIFVFIYLDSRVYQIVVGKTITRQDRQQNDRSADEFN